MARHHAGDYVSFRLTTPTLVPGQLTPGLLSTIRHPSVLTPVSGTGILTRYPSTTPFGLALGSD